MCSILKLETHTSFIFSIHVSYFNYPLFFQTPQVKPAMLERILVMERSSGRVLTGVNAPTTESLESWLSAHPTYEVVKPGQHISSSKFYGIVCCILNFYSCWFTYRCFEIICVLLLGSLFGICWFKMCRVVEI